MDNYWLPNVRMDIDDKVLCFDQDKLRPLLKPGDKVRILRTSSVFLKQYIGTIQEYVGGVFNVRCTGGSIDHIWAFNERDLELVEEESSMTKFSKSDLRNGMLAQLRNGSWGLVMRETNAFGDTMDAIWSFDERKYLNFKYLSDDLRNTGDYGDGADVIKVATIQSPLAFFKSLLTGEPIESTYGFKVIYDVSAKTKLEEQLAKLKEQVKETEEALAKESA